MKIALLIYQFCGYESLHGNTGQAKPNRKPPAQVSGGGVERYLFYLATELAACGHDVHIFCRKRKGAEVKGITFHHVPALGFWSPLKIWSFALASKFILKKRRNEFDIINSFSKTMFQDVLRLGGGCHYEFMKRTYPMMNHPLLKYMVIANPRHLFNIMLERAIFRSKNSGKFVCISEMCKKEYVKRYRIPPAEADVIYNGVDFDLFAPVNKTESREKLLNSDGERDVASNSDEVIILFVGSGFRRKGLRHIIEALPMLNSGINARLIVAGRGRPESYKSLAASLGVETKVNFIGMESGISRLYDAADIFVFPTEYDAFGNVSLEAMAMELPVIVAKSAGSAEIIEDGVDGFAVDYPVEAKEIAKRLNMLADKECREKMGKAAGQKARNYTIKSNAEKTVKLYNEIRDKISKS